MPQSLIIGAVQGAKRQRSADGRAIGSHEQAASEANNSDGNTVSGKILAKPNVRMPPYLEKSRSGMLTESEED